MLKALPASFTTPTTFSHTPTPPTCPRSPSPQDIATSRLPLPLPYSFSPSLPLSSTLSLNLLSLSIRVVCGRPCVKENTSWENILFYFVCHLFFLSQPTLTSELSLSFSLSQCPFPFTNLPSPSIFAKKGILLCC